MSGVVVLFFQAEDGIRDLVRSRGLGDVYKRQLLDKKRVRKVKQTDVERFLREITECQEQRYKSVGLGWDYRFEAPQKVGSALVSDDTVIHMAFFAIEEAEKAGYMSSLSRRRGYRVN